MRNKQLLQLSVVILLVAVMAGSFELSSAASSNKMSLHEYMARFAEYKSNGNATEYNRILNEMLESEKVNAEMQVSTHVTTDSGGVTPLTVATGWMSYITGVSPPTYDQVTGYMVGCIQNAGNMVGQNHDGNYALLWTNGWDEVICRSRR
jgi:hypothetical protein